MNEIAQQPGDGAGGDFGRDDPSSGRLAAYQARSETALDLLSLATLWFVVVPWPYFDHGLAVWLPLRIALSVVYGIDLAYRGVLAGHPARYARAHPLALAAVLFPPVRAIFSFRLVRAMFRRGHLPRFLLAAAVLVANGAIMVYLFERHAPQSNIHTLGESVWWALVTVTTVGYGDYTPVTVDGRITAILVMLVGLLTLAVVTAQVASSFVAQAPGRAPRPPQPEAAPEVTLPEVTLPEVTLPEVTLPEVTLPEVTLADLDRRLARIEALLLAAAPSSPRTAEAPERESGGERP